MKRIVASSTQIETFPTDSNRSSPPIALVRPSEAELSRRASAASPESGAPAEAREYAHQPIDTTHRQALIQTAQAFLIYLLLALLFFGRTLIGHWSDRFVGSGADPSQAMWLLAWWPYALQHHLNPFITDFVWAPVSFNFAWMTSIPFPALLVWPLTESIGVVATYNILAILSVPTAAVANYALCRRLVHSHWPSVMAGFVFGFSSYMLGQQLGHMCLTMNFAVPLAAYLVVRRLEASISATRFIILLCVTMVCQFGIDLEIFATASLVGAITWLVGYLCSPEEVRRRLHQLLRPIAACYAITGLIVSPYLYYFFAYPALHQPFWPSDRYSIDLLNLMIPTSLNVLGSFGVLAATSAKFTGSLMEQGGYLALPLILIASVWVSRHWREPLCKVLVIPMVATVIAALGPFLQVGGKWIALMPWLILGRAPLLEHALPSRLMVFPPLALALIAAFWLSDPKTRRATKAIAVVFTLLLMLPNPSVELWAQRVDTPRFFADGTYQQYLSRKDVVMTLPLGEKGSSMLWQADCDMCFRNVAGWTGVQRFAVRRWPIVNYFLGAPDLNDREAQLGAFVAGTGVTMVIVDDAHPDAKRWNTLVSTLGTKPVTVAGVSLYRINPQALRAHHNFSGLTMEQLALQQRFAAVATAADRYLSAGHDPTSITEDSLIDHAELPADWRALPIWADMHLHPWGKGGVAVELLGSPSALEVICNRYRSQASDVYLPFPLILDGTSHRSRLMRTLNHLVLPRPAMPVDGESLRILRFNFSGEQLHRVALQSVSVNYTISPVLSTRLTP